MASAREAKLKVERNILLKKDFLARHVALYEGWLTEQRASVPKPKLKDDPIRTRQKSKKIKSL